jgi:Cdc6-like AAA superfamily ATPase
MTPEAALQLSMDAGRVFTPTSPVDEKSLFAGRTEQIRTIVDVIYQTGQHAIVYGERGVGKTSLVNVLSSFLSLPSIVAPRVNCDSTDTYETIWRKAFEQVELNRKRPGMGFTAEDSMEKFDSGSLLESVVTPDTVRRGLTVLSRVTNPIFIFDEFDRISQEPRRAFADTIKALSDHSVQATVILVGVADSVSDLLAEHQSVERALVQIQMPRMSTDEITQIITTGVGKIGMTVTQPALRQIARLAQGLPHYAHLLGLYAVRAALDVRQLEVSVSAVRMAIEKAIKGANQSIRNGYELAVRSARKDNLFSDVLLSCALAETSDLGFFAAQDVRNPMRQVTGRNYEIPSFAQHLNEFCDPKRGPILQKTGTRRLYRYRFANPLMQPFVIMQGIQSGRIASTILD